MNLARRVVRFGVIVLLGSVFACTPPRSPEPLQATPGWLPARVWRLSNAEYEQAVSALLGIPVEVQRRLPPDVRQLDGYTRNAHQSLMPSSGPQLAALAEELAARAVARGTEAFVPCAATDLDCRARAIETLAQRAFRRPIERAELVRLQRVFDASAQHGEMADGLKALLSALLQAPSFLYVTELGGHVGERPAARGPRARGLVHLDEFEIASALAFAVRGAPPDAPLLDAAGRATLSDPDERERHARRLLAKPDTRYHFRRFLLQWLEVDSLLETAKSDSVFASYEALKPAMLAETERFVDEVLVNHGASVAALLNAGFSSVDMKMAAFYGLSAYGARVPSREHGRLGVLQQASFLATHAHPDSTSPILRGDFVARKLLCVRLPRPAELDIEVIMPRPSSELTTRERFAQHVANPDCRFCHRVIDGFGHTLESFDAAGRMRSQENGKPIDTSGQGQLQGQPYCFRDSQELVAWLADEPRVHECFARQAFRYFSAQQDEAVEEVFLRVRAGLSEPARDNLFEVLVAWVRSEHFVWRRPSAPPGSQTARQAWRFGEPFASTGAERTRGGEQRSPAETKQEPQLAGRDESRTHRRWKARVGG